MTAGFVLFLYVKSYLLWYFFLITIYKPLFLFVLWNVRFSQTNDAGGKNGNLHNRLYKLTTHQIHKILIAWKNNGKTAAIVFQHTFRSCIKTKSLRHILSVIYILTFHIFLLNCKPIRLFFGQIVSRK